MRYLSTLLLLPLLTQVGCHRVCGGWAPIWVNADCVEPRPVGFDTARPDTDDVPDDTDISDTSDTSEPACEVEFDLLLNGANSATVVAGSDVELKAVIRNTSSASIILSVIEPCPDGLARFSGLPIGQDYYGTCADGICENTGDIVTHSLGAGAEMVVTTVVDLGGDTCNTNVDAGAYDLSFTLPLSTATQPSFCDAPIATLTVQ